MEEGKELQQRLLAWMQEPDGKTGSFDDTALEVFRYQFKHNRAYRHYAEALGRTPESVAGWRDIPAVPTDGFKFPAYPLRCFPQERVRRTFLTSGTTREVRGRHDFESLELYETSVRRAWQELGLPVIGRAVFLSQSPGLVPESSLAHMFATLAEGPWLIDADGAIDADRMEEEAAAGEPLGVFSTAIALVRLMEEARPVRLPEGSWVLETGGYKGMAIRMEPEELRERVGEFFGIPPGRILNEYSMTELSSQFYKWPGEPVLRGPRWTRVKVVDPETGREAAAGETGYLEIVDLANLGSVVAVRTQDLAVAVGKSDFVLLGRDPGAVPRGCSRAADDLLTRR